MARFGLAAQRFRAAALFMVGFGWLAACRGAEGEHARHAGPPGDSNTACAVDEAREYFCDDLLPLSSSRPAPEPYDNCPASSDVRHGYYPAVAGIASFDESFTAYTRKRVQPGHSCCYGWCAQLKVAAPAQAAPVACRDSSGLLQKFCMRELESGTSEPASSPFEHCPAAVELPDSVTFVVHSSAQLDPAETGRRRRDMQLADCCYTWCSQVPAGTVLQPSAQPKIK